MNRPSSGRASSERNTDALRLFTAIELPDALRSRLTELKKEFPGMRWTVPENMHLTLRFMGELGRQEADKARSALRKIRIAPFSLCIQGLGLFERRHQCVLWAGLKASASLLELKRQVDEALAEDLGLKAEHGRFSAHITLSRIRTGVSAALCKQAVEHPFTSGSFAVESFTLFCSVLSSVGAAHSPLERYPLVPGI